MCDIFKICRERAKTNWKGEVVRIPTLNMEYQYEIEVYQDQSVLVFYVIIKVLNDVNIFSFIYDDEAEIMGILIVDKDENKLHTSEVSSTEEFEARLFQIQTMINTYDLDEHMFTKMRQLHRIYFAQKYETVK